MIVHRQGIGEVAFLRKPALVIPPQRIKHAGSQGQRHRQHRRNGQQGKQDIHKPRQLPAAGGFPQQEIAQ